MRNKTPLVLMEQLIMLLIFSLSAAMCLRLFAAADQISHQCEARDYAVTLAQNAAEAVRHQKGDITAALGRDRLGYDATWTPCAAEEAVYLLTVTIEDSSVSGLGTALIQVQGETLLFELRVCWQEVTSHA